MSFSCSPYDSDIAGGILKPTLAGSNQPPGQPEKLVSDDLDSSLANLVGSEFDAFALPTVLGCFFFLIEAHIVQIFIFQTSASGTAP